MRWCIYIAYRQKTRDAAFYNDYNRVTMYIFDEGRKVCKRISPNKDCHVWMGFERQCQKYIIVVKNGFNVPSLLFKLFGH